MCMLHVQLVGEANMRMCTQRGHDAFWAWARTGTRPGRRHTVWVAWPSPLQPWKQGWPACRVPACRDADRWSRPQPRGRGQRGGAEKRSVAAPGFPAHARGAPAGGRSAQAPVGGHRGTAEEAVRIGQSPESARVAAPWRLPGWMLPGALAPCVGPALGPALEAHAAMLMPAEEAM